MNSRSQHGQDVLVADLFSYKNGGVFCEVGAGDGQTHSNTYALEKEFGWTGLLIEPHPKQFRKLQSCRSATCIECAVMNFQGTEEFIAYDGYIRDLSALKKWEHPYNKERIGLYSATNEINFTISPVRIFTLQQLFDEHRLKEIDYLSIDVEGSEAQVFEGIDWSKIRINVIGIENNCGDYSIRRIMYYKGYKWLGLVGQDDFYQRQ